MNKSLLTKFTPQILLGAEVLVRDPGELATLMGWSASRITEMKAGLKDLTTKDALALEQACNRSVGQLAVLGIESQASPAKRERHSVLIRETLSLLAASRSHQPKSRDSLRRADRSKSSHTKKRPTTMKTRAA
jgi:plasmid maintenance system antidote protein VapI